MHTVICNSDSKSDEVFSLLAILHGGDIADTDHTVTMNNILTFCHNFRPEHCTRINHYSNEESSFRTGNDSFFVVWLWLINKTLIYVFVIRVPLLLRSTWQWIIVATFGAKLMSKLKVLPGSNLEQLFLHFPPPLQSLLIPFNPGYLGSSRILELGPRNTSKDSQIYRAAIYSLEIGKLNC